MRLTKRFEPAVATNTERLPILVTALGLISAFLGLAVIIGWHAHIRTLIQIHSSLAPMKYNTALCFVLSGLALVSVARGKRRAATLLGALVTGIAGLTLLQYPLNLNQYSNCSPRKM